MLDVQSIDEKNSMVCVDGRWKRVDIATMKKITFERDTQRQHIDRKHLGGYRWWLQGQSDRLAGKPSASANGRYLEGWYSPERMHPEFLTPNQAATLRKYL
jgi:hypothetical protein